MKSILTTILLGIAYLSANAQEAVFKTKEGAIKGYDVVAYFTMSAAVKGSKEFNTEWMGATWYFANNEHLQAFKSEPEKYLPQYNGYCAYGVAKGDKYPIDPTAWKIVDGKLYLNYDDKVQETWVKNMDEFIKIADQNWEKLK